MNEQEPTVPEDAESDNTPHVDASAQPTTESMNGTQTVPPPFVSSPEWLSRVPMAKLQRWPRVQRVRWSSRKGWLAAAAAVALVVGLSVGLVTNHPASAQQVVSTSHAKGGFGGGGGSNARSAPAPGGATGKVGALSKSGFTMTTSAGQSVTVDETSSTKYQKKGASASASSITKGESVLVLGTVNGSTIKATQVIVTTGSASTSASAASVVPFSPGAPTTSKQVGQIPANWSQGSGTIVSGTAANKATEAALAAYPGGIVDRVVKLSNGEYNVHIIGVNWPHHVFVNQSFKVVGAL